MTNSATSSPASRPASGTEFPELRPGALIEAVPTGVRADGTPITSPIRRRLDRAPWGFDGTSIVISDGRQIDAVHADSVRVIEQAAEPVAIAHPMDLDPFALTGADDCDGSKNCPATDHTHGCYAETDADQDHYENEMWAAADYARDASK